MLQPMVNIRHSGREAGAEDRAANPGTRSEAMAGGPCHSAVVSDYTIPGTGYPLPGGYDNTCAFMYSDERRGAGTL